MDEYTKQAIDLVKGQTTLKSMTSEEMMSMIEDVATKLRKMSGIPVEVKVEEEPEEVKLMFDPKKAIKDKTVTCCICGEQTRVLTAKHLAKHDLTTDEYRRLCGYPRGHPLIAKDLAIARRDKMKEMQLWKRKGGNGEDTEASFEETQNKLDSIADEIVAGRGKKRKKVDELGVGEDAPASEPTTESV